MLFSYKKRIENFDIKIPKILHQTYKTKDKVPQKVFNNIKKYASDYEYIFYDDKDCENFIKNNFSQTHLNIYSKIPNKAHKADFFRYCVLYIKGGIYMDIKSELLAPLSNIIKDNYINTVLSIKNGTIYQGFIAVNPKNKLISELIDHVIKTVNSNKKYTYHVFTKEFYNNLLKDTKKELIPGINYGENNNYYLFRETCNSNNDKECYDGFDRYGRCCNIYEDNVKVIKTRYSDFPW